MHLRPKRKARTTFCFTIGCDHLETVQSYKYLGVFIDEHCDENTTVQQLANAGSRSLSQTIGLTKANCDLGYSSYSELVRCITVPIMNYSIGAWGCGFNCRKMDQVMERGARFYCGLPRNAPIGSYMSDIGWTPGIMTRDVESIWFYNHLLCLPDSNTAKTVFMVDRKELGAFSKNIRNISVCCGLEERWNNLEIIDLKLCKSKLGELYEETMFNSMAGKSKLELFCKVKTDMQAAPYVTANLAKSERSLISQLMGGCLPLEIELGRYTKTERDCRFCKCCCDGVEDELHFLFECRINDSTRETIFNTIPDIRCLRNNIDKLKLLLGKPHMLGRLMQKLWNTRLNILNNVLDNV